ncbi:TetR/AcrR family transcriptional regulator [Deinococcus rubellus]|uniref:TetR/AcrR family transcriptional regulator n=2 Tax=Deinococcus rubellus TaxID=1889240 RepID=A0ABY5YIQ2_9DEIO|nr:TetR/AcrR family transcriptional regulator [Deinococcus rubellus]UWX64222.1 TetR/AcrR family transcriptional regulator [Deinococcus rubellus]
MTEKSLEVRERIVQATAALLAQGGREAASTRAVSAAAGVQPPAIYRQFGDMQGLFSAVARETFAAYVRQKYADRATADPLEDLRRGWDTHVAFGIANPAVYLLMYTSGADPSALRDGQAILSQLVSRLAQAGRLRVSVAHATHLIAAAGEGVTLSLIRTPSEARDPSLSASMFEAVLRTIITDQSQDGVSETCSVSDQVAARAVALQAVLPEGPAVLSVGERQLMGEWLERLAKTGLILSAES